jgi:hypothetical protein
MIFTRLGLFSDDGCDVSTHFRLELGTVYRDMFFVRADVALDL